MDSEQDLAAYQRPEHRLLTVEAMRAVDKAAIAGGTPGLSLMHRAGSAAAERARMMLGPSGRIAILCGPGNNGGDGFVAGRLLANDGYQVDLRLRGSVEALSGDAALAAKEWQGIVGDAAGMDDFGSYGLIVDALFGAGLSRDIDGAARTLIETVNATGLPVLSIDVPSGIDGNTGAVRGAAIRAGETITFVTFKPGHLLQPGRSHCGVLHLADIGTGPAALKAGQAAAGAATFRNGPAIWIDDVPRPGPASHKFSRGHALVLSGPSTRTGAARLSARAALRIGAGLVTLASPEGALAENAAQLTAIMLRRCDSADDLDDMLADERLNVIVLGPGLGVGEPTRELAAVAAAAGRHLVLDADALTSFKGEARALADHLADGGGRAVLTPHEGEFARLFAGTQATAEGLSKLERARHAASLVGAVVVLKGADTVIAAADGRAAINDHGTSYLGTAGSGDVLAGLIGGMLAQAMEPFAAACAAVWMHGDAGRRFGPGLIAEDIPELMPAVLGSLLTDRTEPD